MDPDAALRAIRESFRLLTVEVDQHDRVPDPAGSILSELISQFDSLDEWLKKGGALPKDWKTDF